MDRRRFLGIAASAGVVAALGGPARARGANEKVVVGVMGTSRIGSGKSTGRGSSLAMSLAALPGAEVAYLCDVDQRLLEATVADVAGKQARAPKGVKDFRRILDDKSVDAIVIAAPDHWHTPATILSCDAGKHVFLEKPGSHNAREGELLVAAARKHKRIVQLGTQRRSWPALVEATEALRKGAIGTVHSAQCYLLSDRTSIGRGKVAPVPETLDWSLWQGPAPEREFRDNYVHYNWHWFWHWGTSEIGCTGVHMLDVCRWGLGVGTPVQVTSAGGRLRYDDDQETPDTNIATFKFENGALITFEGRSWGGRSPADVGHQIAFFGDRGTLTITGGNYSISDPSGKETAKGSGETGDAAHLQNFLDAVRGTAKPNAEIEDGARSTLLCHLANIAYRTGRTVNFDAKARQITGDPQASAFWGREYRKGWEPKV